MIQIDVEVLWLRASVHYYSRDLYAKLTDIILLSVGLHRFNAGFCICTHGYLVNRPPPLAFQAWFGRWKAYHQLPRWLGGPKKVDYDVA